MFQENVIKPSLRRQISQNEHRYQKLSQMAYYSNLDKIEKLQIFTKSFNDVHCNVIFTYDSRKFTSILKNQIQLYILRTLNEQVPKLKNKFSLVYIHEGISNFIFFRNTLRLLPEEFLLKLGTVYLVEVDFLVKIVQKFSFGAFNSFFEEKIEHTNRLQDIEQKNKTTLGGGVTKSKMKLHKQQKQNRQEQGTNNLLPTTQIIKTGFYGKQIDEYKIGKYQIPQLIEILAGRLYSQIYFLQKQGILRKSCDVDELEILQNRINSSSNPIQAVINEKDAYVLGGCLKKIFNNLQTPLFSYEIYQMIVSYRSDGISENDINFAAKIFDRMNSINRKVLAYMIAFLKKGIVFYYEKNKMNSYNLAVVFGPCFFRPQQYRLEDLMNSGRFSFMIKLMIDNYESIFGEQIALKNFKILDKQREEYKNN